MDKLKLILKIFLTPFLSVSILFFTQANLYYYPLVFSLVLTFSNFDLQRYDLFAGIILSLIYSYVAFFVGMFMYGGFNQLFILVGIDKLFKLNESFYGELCFALSVYITAPILTMVLLKRIFKQKASKLTTWIIIISTLALLSVSLIYPDLKEKNYFNSFNLWQLITMFGLQLIINQNAILEKLDSKKKPAHNNTYNA